ncbi:uncharacterized protein E0L32_005121 [Thyridium curvatum]|uniref:NmrA-like domain-containing protein n=1 Tax=Thyridium curvatum TaxID=1093900 RepID=A0A507B6J5_9PEZI|nr:uncharacterized protein E0L32_005121 [Thyridium curvatum]TPX14726.1 hypothetical protein E0L32_005121 [Thyridium curvatum]
MATYLITQATGTQSGETIKHLLKAGAKIHALVRDPSKKLPSVLDHPSVKVFKGNSDNFDDVFHATRGCEGVFLNTFPIPGLEEAQARTIVEASRKAGVERIVASTTFFAGDRAMWDDDATKAIPLLEGYFERKALTEEVVRNGGFKSYTILRPAFIHVDYFVPKFEHNYPELAQGVLAHAFNDGIGMLHTDADDIGKYAAAAFQDPAKFGGQEIELGNENLTVPEVQKILSQASGKTVQTKKRTPDEAEAAAATVFAQKFHYWANAKADGFKALAAAAKDVQAKFGIPFTPMEKAMQRDKDQLINTLP